MHHDVMQLKPHRAAGLRSCAGVTLVDVLLTTSLALLTLAAFASFNRFQLFSLRNQATQNRVQSMTRNAIDLVSRDIRRAGRNPTCAVGIEAIADAKQHSVRVLSDHDGDGTVDGVDEDVTYRFGASVEGLERTANGSTDVVFEVSSIGDSFIRYFDASGTELTAGISGLASSDRAKVRRVRIDVALESNPDDPSSGLPLSAGLNADIDLRNRFFVNAVTCP